MANLLKLIMLKKHVLWGQWHTMQVVEHIHLHVLDFFTSTPFHYPSWWYLRGMNVDDMRHNICDDDHMLQAIDQHHYHNWWMRNGTMIVACCNWIPPMHLMQCVTCHDTATSKMIIILMPMVHLMAHHVIYDSHAVYSFSEFTASTSTLEGFMFLLFLPLLWSCVSDSSSSIVFAQPPSSNDNKSLSFGIEDEVKKLTCL